MSGRCAISRWFWRARIAARQPGWLSLMLVSVLSLTACSSDNLQDLRQFVRKAEAAHPARVEPLPQIKPYETYTYRDSDLRDPFSPIGFNRQTVLGKSTSGLRPDFNRPKGPLERYPLDTLRMVGTLQEGNQTWALIRAPDGTVYRVKTGDYMGQNFGKITRITQSKVQLNEIVPDGLGGWMERPASIALK